jgi:hypothetical protein
LLPSGGISRLTSIDCLLAPTTTAANNGEPSNGIAVSSDDKVLFVAGWLGVARVDIASGLVKMLAKPKSISDAGVDGMYFYKGSLVGIQNPDLHPGRVMRYYLNPTMNRIERGEVLESYNPLFEVPTTGTLVDDSFISWLTRRLTN